MVDTYNTNLGFMVDTGSFGIISMVPTNDAHQLMMVDNILFE